MGVMLSHHRITVHPISLQEGTIQGFEHLDKGDEFDVDHAVADASAND